MQVEILTRQEPRWHMKLLTICGTLDEVPTISRQRNAGWGPGRETRMTNLFVTQLVKQLDIIIDRF